MVASPNIEFSPAVSQRQESDTDRILRVNLSTSVTHLTRSFHPSNELFFQFIYISFFPFQRDIVE